MHCTRVRLPGGFFAFLCGTDTGRIQACRWCETGAPFLCDWKVAPGRTCDAPICGDHAFEAGPEKHLCPEHRESYRLWLREEGIAHG